MIAGGASPAVMLKHAAEAIAAGQAETILVCAGENRATGLTRDAAVAALMAVGHPYFEQPYGTSIPGLLRDDRAAPHARVRHDARADGARGGATRATMRCCIPTRT